MKKKKLWILFIITTSVYAYLMLVTVPALKAMAGGMDILDVPPFYDATYIQELLRRLGEEGRHFYLYRQIPVDMIYPGLFAITYYQLIRFFLEKLSQRKLLFLSYFPIIGGISDYLENYKMVVATGDRIRIQKAKESFSQFLDKIDPEINDMNIEDILKDFEDETEEEDMKEEDELEFWN